MRRNARQRAAACLLALLAQAGLIALFMQSRVLRVAQEDESKRLIFVLPFQEQKLPPPPSPPDRPAITPTALSISDEVVTLEQPAPSPLSAAPQAAPPRIDWYGQMEAAARITAERLYERDLHGMPLDSKPKVLDMPERPQRPGDEERYPGAVLTWLNEHCYVMLDPAGSGPKPIKVCKEPTLAQRRAAAHKKELEKAMVPGYIRRPVPKPGLRNR
ncbi:MAG: hypothetical protein ABI645_01710 [Pseudomonadota bacterium]